MDNCCQTTEKQVSLTQCPACHQKGKSVQLITLKALLQPIALETIHPKSSYAFCSNPSCEVVYYSDLQTYGKDTLKVSVFQKQDSLDVPVCYCFGWTRERLIQATQENQRPTEHILEQVQANRCGCEVNNPQGSCCLGNINTFIRNLDKS
ncbi:(2Fe-2S)-binding protein [Paenibacillus motobuensis]|uniref:putative iron-sulfur cluster-binding metallochaperone n=1 Tax=Paenibacillus TaxID=44249 RepID=UPI00203D5524|nr:MULTISPECIES: (2Fe-2S)-binding protein [Paenibacillus]MCM3039489.1 (2Fe-2S)-binding protein [Paenibacillus lutimineralis]MCM3646593.1 (2Fe-2S)-binding protein [Paenibacillus motobuensis]